MARRILILGACSELGFGEPKGVIHVIGFLVSPEVMRITGLVLCFGGRRLLQ